MRLILQNHQEISCLQATLRLFFPQVDLASEGLPGQAYQLRPCYEGKDLVLISRLSRPLSLEVLRARVQADPVEVTTRIQDLKQGKGKDLNSNPAATSWELSRQVASTEVRRELKRQAYLALAEVTGIAWPFGALTGVRPSQVASQVLAQLEAANSEGELNPPEQPTSPYQGERKREAELRQLAADFLHEQFAVMPAKARKLVQVAEAEKQLLDQLPPEDLLVYLGVPFCPSRCAYCSFIAQDASRFAHDLSSYAQALAREVQVLGQGLRGRGVISALYMGGGTPTSLAATDLDLVLSRVRQYLPLSPGAEITVEAGRADTMDRDKLLVLREHGVRRICLNPQTMREATLQRIGRCHTVAQVYQAFELARSLGFDHINMDLILGLPGEGPSDLAYSLRQVLDLGADAITIHSLAFKRSAYLFDQLQKLSDLGPQTGSEDTLELTAGNRRQEDLPQSARDLQAQLFLPNPAWLQALDQAEASLQAEGYRPYYLYRQKQVISGLENTGFARPGKACAYNVGMMSDQRQVIGLGAGAASKRLREGQLDRLYNTKDLGAYMSDLETIAQKKLQFFLS